MHHKLVTSLVAFCLPMFMAAGGWAATVQDLVDQVSQVEYSDFLKNSLCTHKGQSRCCHGMGPQHDLARANIYNKFKSFGLETELDPFPRPPDKAALHNIVATLPGKVHPDRVYVVCAHYDTNFSDRPGADDDGSGTAGVAEAARVLAQYRFDATIKFIAFDAEECGMDHEFGRVGSKFYADAHASDDIRAVVDMDMIAFNPVEPSVHDRARVFYEQSKNQKSIALSRELAIAVTKYGGLACAGEEATRFTGDHGRFDAKGFASVMLIEYNVRGNPNMHKPSDSVDTPNYIDYAYATKMTRGVVGYLATKAGLLPEPAQHGSKP
jgi:hypothetical protein